MLPDDDLVAGVVAEVKKLRGERERILAQLAARQQKAPLDPDEVEQQASRMRDFARRLREMYEEGSVQEKRTFLRKSLQAPDGRIGPIVLNFEPAQNGKRRHGVVTDGALYIRPLASRFHRFRGGGSRIRTGE